MVKGRREDGEKVRVVEYQNSKEKQERIGDSRKGEFILRMKKKVRIRQRRLKKG